MTTALAPEIAALWRAAGRNVAGAGLDPDQPNREAMVLVASALAAAQAQAYAAEDEMHQHLPFELLTADALAAWGELPRTELLTVEMVVARNWKRVVAEFARLRGVELQAAA